MTFIKQNAGVLKSARSWALLGLVLIASATLKTSTATLGVAQQLFNLEVDVVSPSPTAQIQVTPPPGFGPIPCPPTNANNCTTQYPAGTQITVTATSGVPVLGHNWIFAQYVAGPPLGIAITPPTIVSDCIWTTNTCTFVMPAGDLEVHVEIMDAPSRPCTGAAGLAFLDISTGQAGIGSVDPIWFVTAAPSNVPNVPNAFGIAEAHPNWVLAPSGSKWIDPNNTGGFTPQIVNDPAGLYRYETYFTVPANIASLTLNFQFAADNDIKMFLNSTPIPNTSLTNAFATLNGPVTVTQNNPTAGIYTLRAEVINLPPVGPNPTGLLVKGTVRCEPALAEPTADLGDAPDRTNNHNQLMSTYTPPVPANFPTVFNSGIPGDPPGPKHLQPKGLAWLGPDVSFENEADLLPDADGVTNIDPPTNAADRDGADDGVVLPIAIPRDCGQTQFKYTVTSTAAAKLYVNVWFDFNRDGDWNDPTQKCPLGPAVTGSFTEWAVQNELITVPGPGAFAFTTPVFGAANPTNGSQMWMRITLTDQPIAPANGADGSGPAGGYKYGETEDYLLRLSYTELCGVKFNDLNGNGVQNPGEPGLAGWTIEVKDANGNIIGYAVTGANGSYCIVVPVPGTYTVSEQLQAGWTQTAPPSPGTYTVTVPPAHTNLNFGNQKKDEKFEICGIKWNDLDGDGVKDPNEPGLPGWTINMVFGTPPNLIDVQATTDANGQYCFTGLAPGTYTVSETLQPGWVQTFPPSPGNHTVTLPPSVTNINFGNQQGKCDLAIKKEVKPSPLVSGQQATFTITVTNVGNAPCPGPTTVTETVPTGLTLVSAGGSGWVCIGPVCTYALPIPVGGSVSVTYTFNVTAPPGTAITNCATVSNPNDTNPANNQACVTTPVVPGVGQCDREIKKTVTPNPVASGGTVTITLTVTNVGTAPCPMVAGINVADPKPTGMTFQPPVLVTGSGAAGWACFITGPSGLWPGGVQCTATNPLLAGQTVTITFTATVTAPAGSSIQNCAEVTNVGDANPIANNKSCVTINVTRIVAPVDLTLAKLLDGALRAEQEATYVLRVSNVGGSPTTGPIRVTDPLPAQLRFVSATGPGWSCSVSGQNLTCTSALPIAPNASSTILLRVRVAAPAGTVITNCATVETAGDANPANNRGCHTGTVQR